MAVVPLACEFVLLLAAPLMKVDQFGTCMPVRALLVEGVIALLVEGVKAMLVEGVLVKAARETSSELVLDVPGSNSPTPPVNSPAPPVNSPVRPVSSPVHPAPPVGLTRPHCVVSSSLVLFLASLALRSLMSARFACCCFRASALASFSFASSAIRTLVANVSSCGLWRSAQRSDQRRALSAVAVVRHKHTRTSWPPSLS
jgi:hypothetical protein